MSTIQQARQLTVFIPSSEFERNGLEPLAEILREADRGGLNLLTCDGDRLRGNVCLDRPIEETDVPVDDLDDLQLLDAVPSEYKYLFLDTIAGCELGRSHCQEFALCDVDFDDADDGVRFCVVADHDELGAFYESLRQSGVTYSIGQVGDYEGELQSIEGLTGRQREVLNCAYEMGYYDVPREVTLSDIADRLEIDRSTVCEHIQRAENRVLSNFF